MILGRPLEHGNEGGKVRLVVMAVLVLTLGCASSDDELLFDSCNILYQAEDYDRAADCYGALLNAGVHNGPLHHDMANALMHQERFGEAIWHYRQAQVFQPRESELRSHLAKAREAAGVARIETRESTAGQLLFFYDTLSPGELWIIAGVLNALLWTLLCIRLFRRGEILSWSAGVIAVALLVFGATALHKHVQLATHPTAVVLSGAATVRSGQDRAASELFRLPEGVEVAVIARAGGWYEVENPNGSRGWIDGSTVGIIEYGWLRRVRR